MGMEILIITGERNVGKTRRVRQLIEEFETTGYKVGGVISEAVIDENSREKIAYNIKDLQSNKSMLLASIKPMENSFKAGKYYFSVEAFAFASKCLSHALESASVIFVDELGPLELKGGGFFLDVVRLLKSSYEGKLILVIRIGILKQMLEKLKIEKYELVEI